ncbi:MAG TPA: response regulator [Desulfuromonadales bacterium]|nr:response regulator [Desulfuromonadales bacterium]
MTTNPPLSPPELRQRAEELFRASETMLPALTSPEETIQLFHELRVHQIQLEMQNEELRRAHEELDVSQARYFNLYDLAPVGYLTMSKKKMIQEVNLAAATMLGVVRSLLVKEPISRILPMEEQHTFYQHLNQCIEAGEPSEWEMRLVRGDGELFWAHLQVTPAQNGECWITLNDITARKLVEQQLLESNHQLNKAKIAAEAANYAKNQFLAIMSHELRTPMNGILGMTQLMAMTELSEEQREYLGALKRSGENLTLLISDILELSRIVDGTLMLEMTEFALRSSIAQVVDIQRPQAVGKCLDMSVTVSPDVPDTLVGDPLRLRQILLNLLRNAVKFTVSGSVSVTVTVKEQQSTTILLSLTVQDSGIGISPDKLDLIFEPFTQGEGVDTRTYGGAGLGLPLCRRLVELMGGSIHVESSEGYGSLFQLLIPFEVATPANSQAVPVFHQPQRALRVLVAEDDPVNAQFMMVLLEKLGHTATCVKNGRDVLAEVQSAAFDLVLMDIQMPVMNGEEALKAIRHFAHGADIPVIALTAYAMKVEQERFMRDGFDGYIAKPVEIDILVAEIERVILAARRRHS